MKFSTILTFLSGTTFVYPAAFAQSIIASGNILPGIPAPPLALWQPANLRVGVNAAGTLSITDGGMVAGPGQALLGSAVGSSGTVMVSGNDSLFSTVLQMHVGSSGTGTLKIEDRGTANIGTFLYIGRFIGSDGLVTVSGAGSRLTNGNMMQVGSEGTGALIIEDGATVNSTNVTRIGWSSTGIGTAIVQGSGSSWTTNNSMSVGFGGSGRLLIVDGGAVSNVEGFVGRETGSTGEVTVSGAGSSWSNSAALEIGSFGMGELMVEDGGALSNTDGRIGREAGAIGTVTIKDAGSTWSNTGTLYIGDLGKGTLTVADGGKANIVASFVIGRQAGAEGLVTLSGAGSSLINTSSTQVGGAGKGTLIVENGGVGQSNNLSVGVSSGSTGSVAVRGADSRWIAGSILTIGASGHGTLTIEDGGSVTSTLTTIGSNTSGLGEATVSGADSTWTNSGALIVGALGNGTLTVSDGGMVSNATAGIGVGTGRQGVALVSGAGARWINSGDLTVGTNGSATLTVADGGHVSVGGGNGIVHVAEAATANGVVNIGAAAGSAPVGAGTLGAAEVRFGDGTGRLNFNHTDSAYLFSPVITGNGALNHYSGTTILTGDNTYSGSTMIAGGVLQLGNGGTSGSVTSDIQIDSTGTLRIDRSNDWTYAGILSGTGVFDQLGTGTTMLTGNSAAFNGTTTVTNGRLIVGMGGAGTLGGMVNVLDGATLGGSGTVGSAGADVTILGGGVHAPGNSVGVQTIAGNYVNYGTLRIDGTPAGTDMLIVQGGVDITGATLDLQLSPPVASGWNIINGPFTIIDKQSAGAVAGSFGAVNNNLLFLDPYVNYAGGDGNDITLDFVRNDVAFASVALTPNQIATGRGIDTLPYGHPIWNTIALMSDEVAVRRSFDFLSGEIHATASSVLLEESRFPRRAVNDRLRSAFDTNTDTAFWAHGYGAWAGWQSDGNAASLKRDTGGLLLGLDGQLGNWRTGVMTGRSWTGVTVADRASTAEAGTWYAGLYGGTQWGDLGLRLGLLHGEHDIDTRRTVAVPGLSGTLRSTHGASTTQAFGELAHTLHFGIVRYEPFANLAHIHTRSNRFTETGGSMALAGRRSTMSATVMTLGQRIEAAHIFRGTGIRTVGMIGWQHVWGDVIPRSTHRFSMGDPFTIAGTPLARNNLLVEGGFELSLGRRAAIGASYTGRFAHNGHDHAATAVLRIGF